MPNTGRDEKLHVVAGVVRNEHGQVLVTQRLPHAHQGGKWEFPGGKCEPKESPAQALRRELREELGIEVSDVAPRIQVEHQYADVKVFLDVFDVLHYQGQPLGLEGQSLRWVAPEQLKKFDYPAANLPVITSILLPPVYVITGLEQMGEASFFARFDKLLDSGIRIFQFREHALSREEFMRVATRFVRRAHQSGAKVLLNTGNVEDVRKAGADGIHLTSRRLIEYHARPLPEDLLVAASCHNPQELERAEKLNLDFAVLSPVRPTASHPQSKPLGWENFEKLVRRSRLPVYALGGLNMDHLTLARQHGAQGVAILGAAWNPERTAN